MPVGSSRGEITSLPFAKSDERIGRLEETTPRFFVAQFTFVAFPLVRQILVRQIRIDEFVINDQARQGSRDIHRRMNFVDQTFVGDSIGDGSQVGLELMSHVPSETEFR